MLIGFEERLLKRNVYVEVNENLKQSLIFIGQLSGFENKTLPVHSLCPFVFVSFVLFLLSAFCLISLFFFLYVICFCENKFSSSNAAFSRKRGIF